ncbi:MAG TPA: magnesium-translocating P-type ATPase [Casimicrobiaceae bacterium]|nr:magnesium-translocating P-type ATPase [Casimicrobiaceae bacterium]
MHAASPRPPEAVPAVVSGGPCGGVASGLSGRVARERLATYGPNIVGGAARHGIVVEYLLHFRNPLVVLLIAASAVLGSTGETTSMTIILVIVLASVTLDFVQEHRAERALARLQATVAVTARVLRDGTLRDVPVAGIVPGDLVVVRAGDVVPADGTLVETDRLFVDEAALTGESFPAEKRVGDVAAGHGTVRMGSSIASGSGRFVVDATGAATALGAMAGELSAERPEPPLERGARRFGMMILRLTLFLVLFVLLVNAALHRPWLESFLFAVALAVGLTPELLPMIVSITLARGALRLARGHVVVKRPAAIYALGSIDVLCADKTGTLTEARIRVAGVEDAQGAASERVLRLARTNSRFATGVRSPLDDALLVGDDERGEEGARKLDELAFDFVRRVVSVLVATAEGPLLIVKGAPEDVVARCSRIARASGTPDDLAHDARERLLARFHAQGEQGLRVLAVATRRLPAEQSRLTDGDEAELAFEGFVTFLDPPRADAAHAVASLARAGIEVKILTGDNERVARHVCEALQVDVGEALTGREIDALSDDELAAVALRARLFARVAPGQKTRIIRALRARGRVVGFIGDGINDAPAMHAADVGISVDGAAGVAREAADVILTRGRLGVVRDGVLEGRRTYANIMKYLMMATSSNFGNMLSMATATLFLPFLPMLPVQILLNNLLYDVSETAIPFDRVDEAELRRPHAWDVREIRRFMLVLGPVSSLFDFATFGVLLLLGASVALFQTGWFIESIATQVLVIFVIRTRRNPLRSRPHPLLVATSLGVIAAALALPFTPLGPLVGFVAPPPAFFGVLALLVGVYLALVQAAKTFAFRAHAARWRAPASRATTASVRPS